MMKFSVLLGGVILSILVPGWICDAKPQPRKTAVRENRERIQRIGNVTGTSVTTCGIPAIEHADKSKIVGGDESNAGEWPWQVFFEMLSSETGQMKTYCGGILINNNWVITAAHCTQGYPPENIRIHLGAHNILDDDEDDVKKCAVSRIIDHPSYDSSTMKHDISLIQLAGHITYTDYILPACLPEHRVSAPVGQMCWITGWGETQNWDENNGRLREAEVPILKNGVCNRWYRDDAIFNVNVCAGYKGGKVDTCQGDSGGPLICMVDGKYTLQGVTSWGIGCALNKKPGVYTRVSSYVNWINKRMAAFPEKDEFFRRDMTTCGSEINTAQIIRLPVDSETQLYQANMTCEYTIVPPNGTTHASVKFVGRFAIEPVCAYDKLVFKDSSGEQIGSQLCGFNENDVIVNIPSDEPTKMIFTSDEADQFEGFAASVEFVENPNCNDTWSKNKCDKWQRKGKCNKYKAKKKCKETCGYCSDV